MAKQIRRKSDRAPDNLPAQRWTFALRPTEAQARELRSRAGAARWVHNYCVRRFHVNNDRRRCWQGWHPHLQAQIPAPQPETYPAGLNTRLLGEMAHRPSIGWLRDHPSSVRSGAAANAVNALSNWLNPPKGKRRRPWGGDGLGRLMDRPAARRSALWRWTTTRAERAHARSGKPRGRRDMDVIGFPRFRRRGTGGGFWIPPNLNRLSADGRWFEPNHARGVPSMGPIRIPERAAALMRLTRGDRDKSKGWARVTSMDIYEQAGEWRLSILARTRRPQTPAVKHPEMTVGVDVGIRCWAVVANAGGDILHRIPNPSGLEKALAELRVAQRAMDRRQGGRRGEKSSRAYREAAARAQRLHRRIKNIRDNTMHAMTTMLAETYGRIVLEDLNVRGMSQQRGAHGARTRRRRLADASMGAIHAQLRYKADRVGGEIAVADRWFPSSKTCSACGHIQEIGWAEHWDCETCGASHNRDDNAAINLARYDGPDGAKAAPAKKAGDPLLLGARPSPGAETCGGPAEPCETAAPGGSAGVNSPMNGGSPPLRRTDDRR